MNLPQTLNVGDGVTIDRDLALEATRHILLAMKLITGLPTLQEDWMLDLAVSNVAHMLGGDHWFAVADELVNDVLQQRPD